MAANDPKNVKLGVCKVFFGGVDLGFTQGGVDVTIKTETHKVNVDQQGKATVKEYITGREVTVKAPLAETTLANLVAITPGAVLVGGVGTAPARVDVALAIGEDLLDYAKPLILHPISKPESDTSEDFTVFKAATSGNMQFAYHIDKERIYACDFTGYPDSAHGNKLYSIGDPLAV